jgi:hypothetical protein
VAENAPESEGGFSAIRREESTGSRDRRRARRVVALTDRDP